MHIELISESKVGRLQYISSCVYMYTLPIGIVCGPVHPRFDSVAQLSTGSFTRTLF